MLEGLEGDAEFVGEDGVAGGVEEDGVLAERLPEVQRARHHLKRHLIYEHRRPRHRRCDRRRAAAANYSGIAIIIRKPIISQN